MLAWLKTFLVKTAIKKALARKAPNTIPLSGKDRLRQRNYYTVRLTDDPSRGRFLVESVRREGLGGYWFCGSGSGLRASIPNRFITFLHMDITQYAQELELKHRTAIGFFWSKLTFMAQRRLWGFRFSVWAFSKKKLPRQDRMEVLTWAYNWTLESDGANPTFDPLEFLIHKHGELIAFHPERARLMRYYQIVFESLSVTGDFDRKKSSQVFSISPKALATLDRYEETDRRHADNLRQQSILGWLTFGLVLIGLGQIIVAFLESNAAQSGS